MKSLFLILSLGLILVFAVAQNTKQPVKTTDDGSVTDTIKKRSYFIDVHDLEPGKVRFEDVLKAHEKDLATQEKYNVSFLKFWVDENQGKVYCLSTAEDAASVSQTHKEAHGLLPSAIYKVTDGPEAVASGGKHLFLDVHEVGAGKVTEKDVADAHAKDLAVQKKYGVNFINYWVDTEKGTIMCLSEAPDSNAVKSVHKEAHGLLPAYTLEVKQGQ